MDTAQQLVTVESQDRDHIRWRVGHWVHVHILSTNEHNWDWEGKSSLSHDKYYRKHPNSPNNPGRFRL